MSQAFSDSLSDLGKLILDSSLSSVNTLRLPGMIIGEKKHVVKHLIRGINLCRLFHKTCFH